MESNAQFSHYFSDNSNTLEQKELIKLSVTARGRTISCYSARGVFSQTRVDLGTQQLLEKAPELPTCGTFLDLGCGWGVLGLFLKLESPAATVYALDVNQRALELVQLNAEINSVEITTLKDEENLPNALRQVDVIWSNPPIRIGKLNCYRLLDRWLTRLSPQGYAILTVSKNLGADSLIDYLNQPLQLTPLGSVDKETVDQELTHRYLMDKKQKQPRQTLFEANKIASKKGYRIIEVRTRD